MKKLLFAAFAILITLNARAAFVFSDIPWNAPADSVVKKLKAAGFKQIKKDKQGDYSFGGDLLGHDAAGMAMFAKGRLVRVIVMLTTPEETIRETYSQVREVLLNKYGKPVRTLASFVEPFHQGDGYESEAIRSGKAIFLTQWRDDGQQLLVNITSGLMIGVSYESPDWAAELERRKNKGSAAF
ncbi:MAG TPA: hypothetical protein VF505_14100 [Thermoanaerobaculia bacterium]